MGFFWDFFLYFCCYWQVLPPTKPFTPYEVLYGKPYRSPVCWTEVGERPTTGMDLVRDTFEKVDLIRKHLLKS